MSELTEQLSERFSLTYKTLVRCDLRHELFGGEAQKLAFIRSGVSN